MSVVGTSETPDEDLTDLFENAPCGYLSMHPDGRIFRANATLAEWTGYSAAALTSMRLQDLLTVGTRIFYETHALPVLKLQGAFGEIVLDLRRPDKSLEHVFASAVERSDGQGRPFVRLTLFKASERRRYERDLVEARKASDALLAIERRDAELREQFIAILSHDLRNPLASISGGARLLLRETTSERGKLILDMMQGSVTRMAGLIENVMDFARGRLGDGILLNRTDADLEPVLRQVKDELKIGLHNWDIDLFLSLPPTVNCDAPRIGQMVSNLLGNALTHGADTQPVRLLAEAIDGMLIIAVVNGGEAIPPDRIDRLFQPFVRGEGRQSQQGLGLGLHIASEIAKAHGGQLGVASSDAETRFTFRMPLAT